MAGSWVPRPLVVETDLSLGGRWTSLRTAEREWLWSRPGTTRDSVVPGDPFVDAGGVEECWPTVRGTPDHGAAWSHPWEGTVDDAFVDCDGARLRRRLGSHDGVVTADYEVSAQPDWRYVHATHALLDLTPRAVLEAPDASTVLVTDDPRALGADVDWEDRPLTARWPRPWGLPLHRFGAEDGTAVGYVLPGCASATVVDGDDTLRFDLEAPPPSGIAVWRNLGGYPADRPYRTIGVEPLVGHTFDRSDTDRAAVVPESGRLAWTLRCTAARRAG